MHKKYALWMFTLFAVSVLLTSACGADEVYQEVVLMPVPDTMSTFFATASVEDRNTAVAANSDGDLWPSAWAADGYLYTANGDGKGFGSTWYDIVVNRIDGTPETGMTGITLAKDDEVGPVLTDPYAYNRKPTGMAAVGDVLYLAVQDLNKTKVATFNDAPAATIYRSDDKGSTWIGPDAPMFTDHMFTTLFFLDYGQDNQYAPDDYLYVYGLDYNWRASFTRNVPDPVHLYLAKAPYGAVQDLAQWLFFAGRDAQGEDIWSPSMADRAPVLTDERRVYQNVHPMFYGSKDMSVISQGSVTYNQPLDRYVYASWTEYTFELYEAPSPTGPFKLFYTKDFGGYFWNSDKNGGYATTIPSKFISEDGMTMWIISSTFAGGAKEYYFGARKLVVQPFKEGREAENAKGEDNLALVPDATVYNRCNHRGLSESGRDGTPDTWDDSWTGEVCTEDFWGYTFASRYTFNSVEYTTGARQDRGGWFTDLRVQVRSNFHWYDVEDLKITPDLPAEGGTSEYTTYTLNFKSVKGDGIRIIGTPGGLQTYSSMAELAVYYR